MIEVSQNFLDGISQFMPQKVSGKIVKKSGEKIDITDRLFGDISYNRQCVANEKIFGIGQLYSGTAEVEITSENLNRYELLNGTLILEFSVNNETILLGKWTITDPQKTSEKTIKIIASDCINRLDIAINDGYAGAITLEARMQKVTELTGVEFAQTPQEIKNLIGKFYVYYGSKYCSTCRAEVVAIAEFMGGFAFADRENKIKFRKFGGESVLEIPAEMRHRIMLNDYVFGVRGVNFRDKTGHSTTLEIGEKSDVGGVVSITENPYIWEKIRGTDAEKDAQYRDFLSCCAANLNLPNWTPGEVEYYGNPALELGDFVTISGGVNGEEKTLFLITAEHWNFRGPHILISAGMSENGLTQAYSPPVSSSSLMLATVNLSQKNNVINFEKCENTLENSEKIIAEIFFAVREETVVFADITLNLRGLEDSEILINLYFDGEIHPTFFIGKIHENEPLTAHFSAYFIIENGVHTAEIKASGNACISGFSAYLWGQNITDENIIISSIEEMENHRISSLEKLKIEQFG